MNLNELSADDERLVREYDYEDATVIAVDLGHGDGTVDVVGDTAIVVLDDAQYDVDLPAGGNAQAFIKNGVLTIEVIEE